MHGALQVGYWLAVATVIAPGLVLDAVVEVCHFKRTS
jgi:hypothetical protein